ncbi:TonB-dependent receptor domain-containing protein [Alteraurantiacibacter buctensis]|nr:TonB-dependent receptor [Alteraurantiacibacter buctensis]
MDLRAIATLTALGAAMAAGLARPAQAQSVDDNAVASADDAFGQSVGNERIGLYSSFEVRGFSPVDAGNTRIEGLYFSPVGSPPNRVVQGSRVRVGLTAQGYPFPAPTGIIDYQLAASGTDPQAILTLEHAQFGSFVGSVDLRQPLSEDLTVYAGGTIRRQNRHEGGEFKNHILSAGFNLRPWDRGKVTAFYAYTRTYDDEAAPFLFPAGDFLPPQIKRRAEIGQDWTIREESQQLAGALVSTPLAGFQLDVGLFHASRDVPRGYTDLALALRPDGTTPNRVVVADFDNADRMLSGEARLSRTFGTARLAHRLVFSLRGREGNRVFGGAQRIVLGESSVLVNDQFPAPVFAQGPDDRDHTRQATLGVGYSLTSAGRFAIDAGLSVASYRKTVTFAGLAPAASRDTPVTGSITGNATLAPGFTVYGGYIRGFEEVAPAPATAVNRGELPPAITTRQADLGLRYVVSPGLSLVAGVFTISKPYFNSDAANVYRQLGASTNRGAEFSLAGTVAPGVSLVLGTVLYDSQVSGELVEAGVIGPRPVGNVRRQSTINLDWRLDGGRSPLSLDLALDSASARVANARNTLLVPQRLTLDAGLRYRFTLAGVRALVRAQMANLFNDYSWSVSPNGALRYTHSRRFLGELRMEI